MKAVDFEHKLEILNREISALSECQTTSPQQTSDENASCINYMASDNTLSLVMHAIVSGVADEHAHFHASKKFASNYTVTMVQNRLEKLQLLRDFVFDRTGSEAAYTSVAADIILELLAHIGMPLPIQSTAIALCSTLQ